MMTATERMTELDNIFDDHPSLTASLEDFEEDRSPSPRSPPFFGLPSQHSGFRSEVIDFHSEDGGDLSRASSPWSPPGFKHAYLHNHQPHLFPGSTWYRQQPYMRNQPDLKPTPPQMNGISPARSREVSPQYEDALERHIGAKDNKADASDLILPASIPLPGADSPFLERSPSPKPENIKKKYNENNDDNDNEKESKNVDNDDDIKQPALDQGAESITNYIRFAIRAEVQHREPFVAFFNYIGTKIDSITQSRSSTLLTIIIGLFSIAFIRALFLPPIPLPVPDLVKLSSFTRSFEPLIYYSENGVQQIGTLQETGVAVWDLGESVRGTNMTSAPIIVRELDELSESLKSLSLELTRFFANVDADIDSILLVMEWAKRELEALSSQPGHTLSSLFFDNFHGILSRLGALETIPSTSREGGDENNNNNNGNVLPVPTRLGTVITAIFGTTRSQRTQRTLTHTFTELLSVLEECINTELTHSTALFTLFESIDRQFLNLQRTVVRESNAQERAEGEMLSSLWTRVLGPNAAALRKYEKNKDLLKSVRHRTVANKHLLMDHRGRLLALKVNLEVLRRKLVSPLLRRNESSGMGLLGGGGAGGIGGGSSGADGGGAGSGSALSGIETIVDGQIKGLGGAHDYLKEVREKQKSKLMEMVYGAGRRRTSIDGRQGNVLDDIVNSGESSEEGDD